MTADPIDTAEQIRAELDDCARIIRRGQYRELAVAVLATSSFWAGVVAAILVVVTW